MITRRIEKGERKGDAKAWPYRGMERVVQQLRKKIDGGLFTLDACRQAHFLFSCSACETSSSAMVKAASKSSALPPSSEIPRL